MTEENERYTAEQRNELTATVRKWARENRPDLGVGLRGRLRREVWDAYDAQGGEL